MSLLGYSRKNTHTPDDCQTGNSHRRGAGLMAQEILAEGGSEPKISSSADGFEL